MPTKNKALKRRHHALTRARRRMTDPLFCARESKRGVLRHRRQNAMFPAKRKSCPWLPSEDRITQDGTLTVMQCAALMQRTPSAIRNRRTKWIQELGMSFDHLQTKPRFRPEELKLT